MNNYTLRQKHNAVVGKFTPNMATVKQIETQLRELDALLLTEKDPQRLQTVSSLLDMVHDNIKDVLQSLNK